MKINIHKSVHNLQHNQDFLDVMAYIHHACQWDSIYTGTVKNAWTAEEFNGKRSIWALIRSTFKFSPDALQSIEHCGYDEKEDD